MEELLEVSINEDKKSDLKPIGDILPNVMTTIEKNRNAWIVNEKPIDPDTNERIRLTFWTTPNPVTGNIERGYESKTDEFGNREVVFPGEFHSIEEFTPDILEKIKNKDY